MIHLATSSTAHFSVIVVLLVGILTMLSMICKGGYSLFRAVDRQLEATKENTRAIEGLSTRMEKVERKVAA